MLVFHLMLLITTASTAILSGPPTVSSEGASLTSVTKDRGQFDVSFGPVKASGGVKKNLHLNVEVDPTGTPVDHSSPTHVVPEVHHPTHVVPEVHHPTHVVPEVHHPTQVFHPDELHHPTHVPDHSFHDDDDDDDHDFHLVDVDPSGESNEDGDDFHDSHSSRPHVPSRPTFVVVNPTHNRPTPDGPFTLFKDAADVFQPILQATEPLQDAVLPIKTAVFAKPAVTLAAAGLGVKKLLSAKAVLAAPFVKFGSAVAAPFVKVGAKFAALVIKGGKVVGALFLKGAAVKAKTALTLGGLKLAKKGLILKKKAAPLFILKGKKLIPLAAAGLTKAKLAAVTNAAAAAAGTAGLAAGIPLVLRTAAGPQSVTFVPMSSDSHAPHPNDINIDENIFDTESGFDLNVHSNGPLGGFNFNRASGHATRLDLPDTISSTSSSHSSPSHVNLVDLGNGNFAFNVHDLGTGRSPQNLNPTEVQY